MQVIDPFAGTGTFNRTIVELKLGIEQQPAGLHFAFNRTIVELKRVTVMKQLMPSVGF